MTYTTKDKDTSVIMLVPNSTSMSLFEVLGRIDQLKATGKFCEIRLDATRNGIVGVLA